MKKELILLWLISITVNISIAQTTQTQVKMYEQKPSSIFIIRKDSLQQKKEYRMSIDKYLDPLDSTKSSTVFYRLAVNYALLNHSDSAFYYLHKFIDVSPDDRVVIVDQDFNILRSDSAKWQEVIDRIEQLYLQCLPVDVNKKIALDLYYLGIEDQKYRVYLPVLNQVPWDSNGRFRILASDNEIKYLRKIIKEYGFPTISMVGNLGSTHAWLILQHSDKITKYYFKVKKVYQQKEINVRLFALLTDRYLMDKRRRQLYGTQFVKDIWTARKYPGKFVLYPVKDFKNINKRREEMGFNSTVEEYAASWKSDDYIIPEKYYKKQKIR